MENTRGGGGEETSPKHSVVLSFRKFDSENEQAPAAPLLAQCPEFPECYVVVLCNPRHSGSIRAVVRPFGQQTELGIKVCPPEQTAFMEPGRLLCDWVQTRDQWCLLSYCKGEREGMKSEPASEHCSLSLWLNNMETGDADVFMQQKYNKRNSPARLLAHTAPVP